MQNVFDPDQAPKTQGKHAFVVKNILPYLNSALILVILIIIVFSLRDKKEPVLQTPTSDVPLTVAVESLNNRMEAVDRSLEAVREELQGFAQDQFKKETERSDEAEQALKEANEKNVITPQMGAKLAASTKPVSLSQEQRASFDDVINGDNDNGTDVSRFLDSLEDPGEKSAYLKILQSKGDGWFNSALKALKSGDKAQADNYLATANYFYNIIKEKSDSGLMSSHVAAQLSRYDLETQRLQMQQQMAQQKEELENQIAENAQAAKEKTEQLQQDLKAATTHKETATEAAQRLEENRKRHSGIKQSKGTSPTPYKSDWDPDPRVREQRGIIQPNERDD